MTVRAELADGRVLEFPDGTDPSVIQATVKRMIAVDFQPQPQEGIGAALTGGFKRFLSTGETALESLINPELAAQRGVERAQRLGEQYAPGASLEKVKQAYAERGLFPAVGEAVSQIPAALAEQAPQIAATLGAAKLGAMAGSPLGPAGALVGGIGGAVAPSLMQLYGSNIERQAQEGAPEISRAGALAAAAPGAALEVASTFIPLGRNLVGKLLGPNAEKALARGSNEAIERRAQEALTTSLLKGTAVGAAVEIPTEVTQQMLERFQAGLPLTTEDALKEYGEAAYGAGLVGGPFGAGARALGRPAARAEAERIQQEEAARLAVPEEELEQRFPDVLPGGFKIEREELGREMAPEGYSIMAEGREEPLSVVDTQEEADAKLASLTKLRAEERDNLLKEEEKINSEVQKARDKLERLEATEQTDTDEYRSLKAEFPAMLDESAQKIKSTYDKIETLSKPLTVTPFGEVERVNEQFKLFGPDAKEVGAFKTREQAEGAVEQAVGEETFKQTKANREAAKQLYKTFVPQMRKFGLGEVGLEIVDKIDKGAGGAYLNKLIKVSLEDATPLQTMRHEAVHALKDLGFFTPQQWNVLSDRAKKTWIEDMKKTPYEGDKTRHDAYIEMFTQEGKDKGLDGQALDQYVNDSLIEEAVADAFGAYDKGAKPPPGMIAALVRKLKDFFAKLSQALRGSGFTSAEDIFQTIERGGLKPAAKAEAEPEVKPEAKEKLSITQKPTSDIGHKREASTGRYVGAPDWVGSSPQQLTNLRKKLVRLANEGESGRFWYENSSKAILDLVGGDKKEAEKIVGLIAIYSPNATVPANTSMALNAYYQYKTGQPISAGLSDGDKKAEELLRQGKEWSGIKTNSFYQNLMVAIDPSKLDPGVATMDMWMALAFDYGMKALDQGPKYKFAEREIQRLAAELGWDAHQVQAAIWTAMKGRIDPIRGQLKAEELKNGIGEMYEKDGKQLYRVKPDRRYDHFRLAHKMGMEYNLRPEDVDASKYDFSNAINDRSVQMSWEATPGASTGVLPGLLKAPIDQKFEYLEAISKALKGKDGQDKIAERIGLPSGQTIFGFSAWQGDIGAGAQTFIGAAMRGAKDKRDLTPEARNLLNLYSAIKGYVLSQEAVVWHVPSYDGSIKNQNGLQAKFNRSLSAKEMKALYEGLHEKFGTWEIAPGYIPEGFRVLNFTDIPNKNFHKGVQEVLSTLPNDFGGGMMDFVAYRSIGDYIGNDWTSQPNGEGYETTIASVAPQVGIESRSDLLDWAANLRADVEAVNKKFSDKYGWGKPSVGKAESKPAKLSLKAPTSPEFKQWFGDSKVVNKDGTPMVMYHGLAKDTTDFTRKTARGAPIFLTDDPEFAARFAADSHESVAANPEKYLSKDEIAAGVKRAVAAIRKDYGKDSFGKEMIESLKSGTPKDATPEAREYLIKEFINLLPAGPHIMPLYVRAERPFDYDNRTHISRIKEELAADFDTLNAISNGDWDTIESAEVQEAIKMAGFDSFYVKETGRKNLAVYDPNQVKSATGNVGTFSRTSPDVRYSLRGAAFPTVKEAQKAADDTPVPDTEEFKRYIAGSQWVDEEGKAKKFFHATTSNFFEFKDGVIYLSESAADSEKFGLADEDRLRANIYRALNKDEKLPLFQRAVDKAVEAGKISAERGQTFMRDAKRKVPDFGKYTAIKEEMDAELIALAPERMKIMPLYARAMTPFDFRNPDHVDQVVSYIERNFEYYRNPSEQVKQEARERGFPTAYPDDWLKGLRGLLVQGYEKTIEQPPVQNALRRLSFDGYVTRKNRTAPLNYAIYKPQQVKSITGNDGQFSVETKDMRYSLKKVRYSNDRFNSLWDESMYTQNGAENKTKGYLAFVDPMDFVKATSSPKTFERLLQEKEPLDIERLTAYKGIPYLSVSEKNGEWKITGHEGRHRLLALHDAGYREIPVYIHLRAEDAKSIPVKVLKAEVPDAMSSILMAAEVEPLSYANKQKAMEKFTQLESTVKFSLPRLSDAANNRIREVAPGRIDLGFKDRVIGAFKQDFTGLRQRFLNRYETIAVYDRAAREKIRAAGGPELLADQTAEFAALQSDLSAGVAASAIGVGDRQGGVPVYRNGLTTIDTSVKGLAEALAPLARQGKPEKGQPDIYSQYQFWAGWKRARRMLREGREELYTPEDIRIAQEIEAAHPEFIDVQKDLIAFNNGIVKYAVQTGVLSRERARVYTQYADYIPFYRQLELDKTIGPNPFSGISGQRGPRELRGGDAPLADFLETMVRNTQSMINAGMKNIAAQRATKIALETNQVERLPRPASGIGVDVYTVLENGNLVYYRANDKLFIDALASLNMPDLPFLGLLSAPANVLRNLVTKDPGFMMANLLRDSLSSYVTSGQNVTPIVGTMVNFGKALSGKDKNLQALFNAGVVGGYEFSQNIQQSGETLTADLNKKAGKDAVLLRPFKSLWQGLEKGTTASDAATRMAIYERVMQETGNEAEAISRALEVMNFNRKGNSVLIRIATAALPFFNARLQGLDLFYRASRGRMNTQDAAEIKKRFWVRGATMMALSVMYYLSVAGDDEYERQEEETKDNNWIFPSLGIRIPIPFEVGTLFKTLPERITALILGNDTGKDFTDSTLRALANTFAFNPIPQTFKPIIEVATNYNFFTMRPIVGQGMQDVAPQFQVGPGTSKTAETIGGMINVSPMKLDQLIKGYTGTMGGYLVDVVDSITNEFADIPKASKRFEQLPVVKRFALDPEARGSVTQFYEMQKSVDTFVRTANLLEKTARPEEYVKYVQDNLGLLAAKDYISSIEKEMTKIRDTKRIINSSDMPSDEKRDLLVDLGRLETNLTSNIKTAKRAFSELK